MRSTVRSRTMSVALSGCAVVALSLLSGAPASAAEPVGGTGAAVGAAVGVGAAPVAPSKCATTAADALGWGKPTVQSDFEGTALPPDWHAYGPEPGHDKKGTRSPAQITVADGVVTLAGDEDGNTAAMSWHPGLQYGRWEACVRSEPGAGGYHPVILLWPVKEDWPVGGEIDWMEISADDRQDADFFLHYGADNDQEYGSVSHDATEWTAWALEWTPEKMTAYVDGKEWYSTTETGHFPPAPMNMTVQLDLFPPAGGRTAMQLDWAKQWALPESVPAELSLAPGAPATGQGDLHPDRTPKPLADLPRAAEPAETEPAADEPAATQPSSAEPAATEPAATEPAAAESAGTEPGASDR
ncbi:glycoside hydrolase family 16 protein [Pseudonocardia xishanensis]